jgi:DTW domain-containing protein YfiP
METRTHFVFLMHPKEFKREKAGTGRLTHLCLRSSEIVMGAEFATNERVQELIADAGNFPLLVYPGSGARNLSSGELVPAEVEGRKLVVFLIDATWACARKMLRLSPNLQALPRVMFTPQQGSRYIIKQQPQEGCLSTLEAAHELLLALETSGLDRYEDREQLLSLFARMQEHQIRCAADPTRGGYRRKPYKNAGIGTPRFSVPANPRRRYLKVARTQPMDDLD